MGLYGGRNKILAPTPSCDNFLYCFKVVDAGIVHYWNEVGIISIKGEDNTSLIPRVVITEIADTIVSNFSWTAPGT